MNSYLPEMITLFSHCSRYNTAHIDDLWEAAAVEAGKDLNLPFLFELKCVISLQMGFWGFGVK
jgi:hypothetical protein